MNFLELQKLYDAHVLPTYSRQPIAFTHGDGGRLFDHEGRDYIDFASGIGVNSVGHAHPKWVAAVTAQAAKLAHCSNLYYTEPGGRLAERLTALSGLEKVFFANSGAEANEGLVKLARKYSLDTTGDKQRYVIATLDKSFHGRTHTTLAATGQEVFHKHFQPLTGGFVHVPANDIDALKALDATVCALLIEPVRGEGGVLPCDADYLRAAARLCEERGWLLMFDEVQTGVGRCGHWFAFEEYGVKPDALSFAKGVAGGLPLGGFIVGEKAKNVLTQGLHGSTYGGNPICAAAALATLDIIEEILPSVNEKGAYIRKRIADMRCPLVKELRGLGLMLGIAVDGSPAEMVSALLKAGLICLTAGGDAIRLLPPLTISYGEIDKGLDILEAVWKGMQ